MKDLEKKRLGLAGLALALSFAASNVGRAQSWQPLVNQPSFGAGTALLLTDGTVMVQQMAAYGYGSAAWWRLSSDASGSYVNGSWSQLASLPPGYAPVFFSSAVLPDGRVIVEGGEYNFFTSDHTNLGAIYDPVTNTWTSVAPPAGWDSIGDAQNAVLANGQFMLGNCCSTLDALLNPAILTWSATGTGKADSNNEEGWTLLPGGSVLTVDVGNPPYAEKYLPSTGEWVSAGTTVVSLVAQQEIGPAVLRPNGTVFATGATSHTAIYSPAATPSSPGTWTAGPDFPSIPGEGQLTVGDAPASLLPSGHVLVTASPGQASTHFFEFDGSRLTEVPGPPHGPLDATDAERMLLLPTGQVLFTDTSSDVEIYTPAGSAKPGWAPTITSCPATLVPNNTYKISGTQFNGLSQAVAYGDDAQAATNYPLVRISNRRTGHVFYARTHNHSTMGVATGKAIVSTYFDAPSNLEQGKSDLTVVANGIPSARFRVFSPGTPALSGRILKQSSSGTVLTLYLQITNSGTGDARDIQITDIRSRTLTGTGTVTFLGRLPLAIGNLPAGTAVTVPLGFNASSTVTKFSLAESGSLQNSIGGVYSYSIAQVDYNSK